MHSSPESLFIYLNAEFVVLSIFLFKKMSALYMVAKLSLGVKAYQTVTCIALSWWWAEVLECHRLHTQVEIQCQ